MTPKQLKWYRGEWAKVLKVMPDFSDEDRRAIHASVGAPASSKDFTQADLDNVLAAFWTYTKPDSLNAQLRQQAQPTTRLDHRIADQLKCLALFLDHSPQALPSPGGEGQGEGGLHPNTSTYLSRLLRHRFHVEQIADLTDPSDLTQLRNTLSDRLSKFRREHGETEHDMCARAGVHCFRSDCATCRDVGSSVTLAPSAEDDDLIPF